MLRMGTTYGYVCACAVLAIGCGAGETRIDPADLELRDLLGIAPEVAVRWDGAQRAAARRVIADGLRELAEPRTLAIVDGDTADDRVIRTLAALDTARAAEGERALGLVQLTLGPRELTAVARDGETAAKLTGIAAPPATELWLGDDWGSHAWGYLPGRGRGVLAALAADAGHVAGPIIIAPAARLSVIAGYLPTTDPAPPRLVVNPIVLAALEPEADEAATTAAMPRPATGAPAPLLALAAPAAAAPGLAPPPASPAVAPASAAATGAAGNPYSFYGSVAECAFAQRTHCDACVAADNCQPVTDTSDGNAECMQLGDNDGRGYFLLCINLALAIRSVDDCAASKASSCARSTSASTSLATLEANADFLDDPACGPALDTCLAKIYGTPPGEFPGVDGGTTAPVPARNTAINCQDSCSNNNSNNTCNGPSADCTGPSCNNSLSCDSACSSSNDQNGCGGNCDTCNSSSSSGNGGSCGGSSSSSSGSCGSCGGGGGGDSCGGGGCGGDSSKCGSSGGGNGCAVAKQDAAPGAALLISILWALLPVPAAAMVRRRARRRRVPRDTPDGGAAARAASPRAATHEDAL
jgi:hypothetical protein